MELLQKGVMIIVLKQILKLERKRIKKQLKTRKRKMKEIELGLGKLKNFFVENLFPKEFVVF
jgi:hypothetical protein